MIMMVAIKMNTCPHLTAKKPIKPSAFTSLSISLGGEWLYLIIAFVVFIHCLFSSFFIFLSLFFLLYMMSLLSLLLLPMLSLFSVFVIVICQWVPRWVIWAAKKQYVGNSFHFWVGSGSSFLALACRVWQKSQMEFWFIWDWEADSSLDYLWTCCC